jgi:hypothetical protein
MPAYQGPNYNLLLLGERPGLYYSLFDFTGWRKMAVDNKTPEEMKEWVSLYDAILVDEDRLRTFDGGGRDFLDALGKVRKPIIFVAQDYSPERHCNALDQCAAGFIAKETYGKDPQQDARNPEEVVAAEIDAIIRAFDPDAPLESPHLFGAANPLRITALLQRPNVCFAHWSRYFRQPAEKVFDSSSLGLLCEFDWDSRNDLLDLREIVRRAIYDHHINHGIGRITVNNLPKQFIYRRLDRIGQHTASFVVSDESDVRAQLHRIGWYLDLQFGLVEIAQRRGTDEAALRAMIASFQGRFPHLVTPENFPKIFAAL